jgi:hypothetical protein
MTALKRWLALVGWIQVSAIIAVFMPKAWMDACSELMGVDPLAATPLAGYLARLSSAMYVVHGSLLLVISKSLPKHLAVVPAFARTTLGLAAMMLWIDVVEGMPVDWTAMEFLALFVSGCVMEWLARRAIRMRSEHASAQLHFDAVD